MAYSKHDQDTSIVEWVANLTLCTHSIDIIVAVRGAKSSTRKFSIGVNSQMNSIVGVYTTRISIRHVVRATQQVDCKTKTSGL